MMNYSARVIGTIIILRDLPNRNPWLCRLVAVLVTLPFAVATTFAQTNRIWDGGGADNNWSTPGNWSSDNVPDTTGEAALFTNDPVGQTKLVLNLSADVTNGQVRFSATAPSYTITGTGPSTLFLHPTASYGGVALVVESGAADQTITAAEVEFLSSQTWDIGGTTTLLVTGTIEDAPSPDYALTKNGTGTLIFSGDVRYDGPTTINGGSMFLSYSNGSMLSALTVNAGVLRATTNANALGNNNTRNTITLAGGALELANTNNLTYGHLSRLTAVISNSTIRSDRLNTGPGLTYTLGTLRIGARTLTVSPGPFVTGGTAGITFGTTTLTNNGAVFNVASGANLTLGALGGNFTFTNQGSGQLTLNTAANANRTSARVTLSGGTMRLGNAGALGTAAVPLTLNGGTLDLAINSSVNAHNTTIGGNATIASSRSTGGSGVTHTLGTLAIGSQTLSVAPGTNATSGTAGITFGATTLSGNATFDVVNSGSANAQLTLGAVGETGGARSLTKTGNGTLRLNGAGSYTGGTTLSQGTITLGVANALGSGGFNFAGGTLNASNTTDNTIGALTLTANSTLNLSPGGAAATLTFVGVSGTANGILTITGWSGVPGGLGTDDKIIFSGGTPPDADFLQHIQFDLGGGNIYPAALGAGGELHPVAPSVLVPDVVGLAQAVAETDIVAADLSVGTISHASSATVPAGIVLEQDLAAGASVPPGSAVSLLVSTGPSVPSVVNLTEAAATDAIINAGLSVGTISNVFHETVPAGFVISQNPSAGTSQPIGSPVNLVVSAGILLSASGPADQTACPGSAVVFDTVASGTGPYSYQWFKGVGLLSDETNASLTLNNVGTMDATNYSVRVTGASGSLTNTAILTLNVPVSATGPVSLTNCGGDTVILSTAANGTGPFNFQWFKGQTLLVDETNESLTLNEVGEVDAGDYSVVVSGACGIVTNTATLTVNVPVSATGPEDQTRCPGDTVMFSTAANGTGPFSYQWFKGETLLTDETGESLTLNEVGEADAASYSVVVSGACGIVTNTATLTVNLPVTAIGPTSVTNDPGSTVLLNTLADGSGPLSYQWFMGSLLLNDETNSVLTLPGVSTNDSGEYSVVVVGACGIVTNSAILTVAYLDTDGDGIPDFWELANGTDPNVNDAGDDPDSDGMNNLQEFIAGTSPTNSASALRIELPTVSEPGFIFSFTAISNRDYTLQLQPQPGDVWQKWLDIAATSTNRTIWLTKELGASNQFYRVVTPLQP